MYYNNVKEEIITKIMLIEIKMENLIDKKVDISYELNKVNKKIETKEKEIIELEKEKEEIMKNKNLSPNERNIIQESITQIFKLEDEIIILNKEKEKYMIKERELIELLNMNEEIKEKLKRELMKNK